MKLELETNPSAFPFIDNDFVNNSAFENDSAELKPLLQQGIKAAKEGNRMEAKQLLLSVTEAEPDNEDALMWLASISEYPEELLGYLNNVLNFNPHNERASDWAKSTHLLLANDFLQRGIEASKKSQKEFARQNFLQAVAHNEENETAWLWLATVSDCVEEKNLYLRKVLNLNPENENALLMLKSVKNQNVESLFIKAVTEASTNKRKEAKETLEMVLEDAPGLEDAWVLKSFLSESFDEKITCYEQILELNSESPLANVNWTALLELMARAETVEMPEEQFSAAADENKEEVYDLNFSDETPESEQNNEVAEEVDASELPTQKLHLQTDSPVEETYFENEETGFEEVKFEENSEDYFVNQPELNAEPQIEMYYNNSAEDDDEVNLLEYQTEDAAETPAESESENFENQEVFEVSEEFPNYSYNSNNEETIVSEPENNSVSYYEADEDVFASTAAAETDYSQSFEETERNAVVPTAVSDASRFRVEDVSAFEDVSAGRNAFGDSSRDDCVTDFAPIEKPHEDFALENQQNKEEAVSKSSAELVTCPYCKAKNEPQEFVCNSCQTMLTLSDLEMLLAHQGADKHTLQYALEEMEAAGEQYELDAEELKMLGIGHINLKHLRLGLAYLQDALKLNPNDVVLSSQVNALAIRLAEIEEQENIHSSMPKNRKILVVDDSATVRKLISAKLSKSGHEVVCAIDGIEALEKINEIVPDLILLDINMPRMDGYQVCKLIRNNEATKDVPVVMISGKDGFFDKVRGRMAGTTGYITKPFGPETLMKTVETYIV
ncbi:hypothetical protein BH20ACI1_BH20ACI1_15200 [soil metagenome]